MSDEQQQRRAEHCREIARLGGLATAKKPGHMSMIGKRGFKHLAMRLGDNGAAVSYLQKQRGMTKLPRATWTHNVQWNTED